MKLNKKIDWSDQEIETLTILFKKGYSDKKIGEELNLNYLTVRNKRKHLGLMKKGLTGEAYINKFKEDRKKSYQRDKEKYWSQDPEVRKAKDIAKQKKYQKNIIEFFMSGDRLKYWKFYIRRKKDESRGRTKYKVTITPEDLEEQWLKQNGHCNYMGLKLRPFQKDDPNYDTERQLSVDQIEPGKGYVKGNIQFVSYKANTLKSDYNHNDFLELLECMLENGKTVKK